MEPQVFCCQDIFYKILLINNLYERGGLGRLTCWYE